MTQTTIAKITETAELRPDMFRIWLEAPDTAAAARPGQFVMVRCGPDTLLRRPLSIHRVDETRTKFALLFNTVGKGTEWLARQQAGDNLDILGPLGNGFRLEPSAKNILLVAGGMGIAPLVFLAERAKSEGYMIHVHEAVNSASQLMLEELSTQYMRVPYSGAPAAATQYDLTDTIPCTDSTVDGSAGVKGLATVCIPGLADWADQVFACGPVGMYRTMAAMPELQGKNVQISLEMRMACGLGLCYSCTVKTTQGLKQVCRDGPVFDLHEILWDQLAGGE